MIPAAITYLRIGKRVYKRVGLTNTFRLEATYATVGKARRFCANQPHSSAIRYEWLADKLGYDNIKLED